MMDILDDIALELQDIREEQSDLEEGLDAVSDDLSDVEPGSARSGPFPSLKKAAMPPS